MIVRARLIYGILNKRCAFLSAVITVSLAPPLRFWSIARLRHVFQLTSGGGLRTTFFIIIITIVLMYYIIMLYNLRVKRSCQIKRIKMI